MWVVEVVITCNQYCGVHSYLGALEYRERIKGSGHYIHKPNNLVCSIHPPTMCILRTLQYVFGPRVSLPANLCPMLCVHRFFQEQETAVSQHFINHCHDSMHQHIYST